MSPLLGLCASYLVLGSPCLSRDGRPPAGWLLDFYILMTLIGFLPKHICFLSCPAADFHAFSCPVKILQKRCTSTILIFLSKGENDNISIQYIGFHAYCKKPICL